MSEKPNLPEEECPQTQDKMPDRRRYFDCLENGREFQMAEELASIKLIGDKQNAMKRVISERIVTYKYCVVIGCRGVFRFPAKTSEDKVLMSR